MCPHQRSRPRSMAGLAVGGRRWKQRPVGSHAPPCLQELRHCGRACPAGFEFFYSHHRPRACMVRRTSGGSKEFFVSPPDSSWIACPWDLARDIHSALDWLKKAKCPLSPHLGPRRAMSLPGSCGGFSLAAVPTWAYSVSSAPLLAVSGLVMSHLGKRG